MADASSPAPVGSLGLSESPLLVPGAQALTGGAGFEEAREVQLSGPEAVAVREESQSAYHGLSVGAAEGLADRVFPGLTGGLAGGLPALGAGERVVGFPSDFAAQLDLANGGSGVLESSVPVAVEASPGARVPIDLGLAAGAGAFEPRTPLVGVRIPKRLGDGVSVGGLGVSLTAVDAGGSPLGGSEGVSNGSSVFYGNIATDADELVKASEFGFEMATVLRSAESPRELSFRVGLPEGASLVEAENGSGAVNVVKEGSVLARIPAAQAWDAVDTPVPVSVGVSGDVLTVKVDRPSGAFTYPIVVDPILVDEQVTGASKPTNWKFCVNSSTTCAHEEGPFKSTGWGGGEGLVAQARSSYKANETAAFVYQTQGESHIYSFAANVGGENAGANIESVMQVVGVREKEGKQEEELEVTRLLSANTNWGEKGLAPYVVCPRETAGEKERTGLENCLGGFGNPHNVARFQQTATGSGSHFSDSMWTAAVKVEQPHGPSAPTFNTTSVELAGRKNVLYAANNAWLSPSNGAFEVVAKDPGVGVSALYVNNGKSNILTHEYFQEGRCSGIQCNPEIHEIVMYNSKMADGETSIYANSEDNAFNGYGPGGEAKGFKVDATPPRAIVLNGLPGSGVVSEAEYHLQAQATDGSGSVPSSGVKSIALFLDGFELPGKSGSCAPGPCTAAAEWTLDGEDIGAGKHTLTIQATDNAGNKETKPPVTITVRHAGGLSVGPGSVDPITGAMQLGGTDAAIAGAGGALTVSRSYNSRQLTAGEQGSLGPQWSLNIGGSHSMEQEPTGSVVLVGSDGGRTTFESNGKGGFVSPKGDENLGLETEKEGEKIKAYLLKDRTAGTTVKYTQPGGEGPWVIASSEGALSKTNGEKEAVQWERLEGVTRPTLALAPAPIGVTCSATVKEPKELAVGCRALSFTYASETTATGEAPSEWKGYKGRLMSVSFTAYSTASKTMETTVVAEYAYDKQGHLRAVWDPRITPAQKTAYGYDSEGHVTSVVPAGMQPWLLHYGTTTADPAPGRLLSVTRPPAGTTTALKEADEHPAPANTVAPKLSSTTPVVGTTLSVSSNGTWSNSPLAYSYAWEDCTLTEEETCSWIPGAVNGSYTPQERDAGYRLRVQVSAVNADGSTVARTSATSVIAGSAPSYLRKFGTKGEAETGQLNAPTSVAVDSSGNVWVVDHNNSRVEEWSSTGTWLHTYGKKGSGSLQFSEPEGIAINQSTGNLYIADKGNNRIEELGSKGEYITAFGKKGAGAGELNQPSGVAIAPNGNVWVGDTANNRVSEFSETGEALGFFGGEGTGNGQFKAPDGIAFSGGNAYVVDTGNSRVQEFSLSGQYIAKFGSKGTGNGQFETAYGISTEPVSGDLVVADSANNRIQEFNAAGTFLAAFGKKGEGNGEFISPDGTTVNSAGDIYVADTNNNRVQELSPTYSTSNPLPEPPALGSSSVTTIDYNIPLWGEGAPDTTAKTSAEEKSEREKWGQTDDPAEPQAGQPLATAVFPPDEPMGWPAKDYKRASITYMDELGRTVNRALATGGIATSEYNETNNVIRTLSADNRATALKEANTKEASELLDTKSHYNGETKAEKEQEEKTEHETGQPVEPGTRLLETRGPQHTVKLTTGSEVKARAHLVYSYDEGSPSGLRFNLPTKTTDGAEYEGKEADVRTTITSYSGQENLGWLLRKPTSVTTDPSGLHLTRTTIYDPTTGEAVETRQPGSQVPPGYVLKFGSVGTENGQFKGPKSVAIAPNGNLYVSDRNNFRVEEFSPTGVYITKFGSKGTGNGQFLDPVGVAVASNGTVYVLDDFRDVVQEFSASGEYISSWGSTGKGNGQLSEPQGLAIAPSGNVYIADANNDRVEEFSSSGSYVAQWGTEGTGNGQFRYVNGVAVTPNGDVYAIDSVNRRVQKFTSSGGYLAQWGSEGTGNGQFKLMGGIAAGPGEDIYVTDYNLMRVQEFTPGGEYITKWGSSGTGNEQFSQPEGIAVTPLGDVYVASAQQTAGRVQEFVPDAFGNASTFGLSGTENGQLRKPSDVAMAPNGNLYVVDKSNSRIQELKTNGEYVTQWGSSGSNNSQFKEPSDLAIASNGNVYVADKGNNRVQEFTSSGTFVTKWGSTGKTNGLFEKDEGIAVAPSGNVYVVDTGNHRVQEFTSSGGYVTQWGEEGTGNGQFKTARAIAAAPNGNVYVIDSANKTVQEFTSNGVYVTKWGSSGSGNGQFIFPQGIAVAASGNVYVSDYDRTQEFTPAGEYITQWGSVGFEDGQLEEAEGLSVDSNGTVYIADTFNNRISEWTPTLNARDPRTLYYTTAASSLAPGCGKHPEWAGLPCQSLPAGQPAGTGQPQLPITTTKYNIWDEPETITEKTSVTRTKKIGYDPAGRVLTNEETSSHNTALPKVTNEYNTETGILTKQSTTIGEVTKTLTSVVNTLGQMTAYTDASGSTTEYLYAGPANDGQVEEVKYGSGKGSQIYSYDSNTETVNKLLDVGPEGGPGAGTFTAGYDVEGQMTSQSYPNGMTAKYTQNAVGEATGIEYEKTTHCSEKCAWFTETATPSIHGELLTRTSTLAKEQYTYNNAGWLTQVNETPAGKGCTSRIYGYDDAANRISLTTRKSETETCPSTGGTSEAHAYDEANRLIDTGTEYETFGNQSKTPAADAGEHEITASFYVDSQVASQKQNSETTSYTYDPAGRTEKTTSEGTTNATITNHYASPGETISWQEEGTQATRNVPGIDGTLVALQHNSETPTLQLHDLEGNIIATAALSETETKLLTTYNPTEYGVPTNGTPPTKLSWLGATGLSTEQATGAANPGGSSYVTQLGKALQTQPVIPPGAFPNGSYTGGPYTVTLEPWVNQSIGNWGAGGTEREAARQAAAKQKQEEEAAAWNAAHALPPGETPSPEAGGGALCEGEKLLWCEEYGVATGQLPSGTDPYLGHGIWVAFNLKPWGLEVQFHFNKEDSLYLASVGPVLASAWVLATLSELDPIYAAVVAGAFATAGVYDVKKVEHNNCIGVSLDDGVPFAGFYRSKKECG